MSNANLGNSIPPVNDKTSQDVEIQNSGIEALLQTINTMGGKVSSIDGGIAQLVELLRLLIDRLTDREAALKRQAAEAAKPPIVVSSPQPMGGKPLGKHLSRKAMKASREEYAIAVLVKSQGKADIHEIAAAVAKAYGGCNFGTLYKYERFNQLYKAAQEMQRQQAREQKKRGFVATDGDVVGVENPDQ